MPRSFVATATLGPMFEAMTRVNARQVREIAVWDPLAEQSRGARLSCYDSAAETAWRARLTTRCGTPLNRR